MVELWKDIKGFNGKYQISNTGKVKSVNYHRGQTPRILKPRSAKIRGNKSYLYVTLSKENIVKCYKIHRLVAEYFVPNPLQKPYVNHIDGNKHNNRADNLEWVTPLENNLHSFYVLNKHPMRGFKFDKNKNSKPIAQFVVENGNRYHLATYCNAKAAAAINNLCAKSITNCCLGKYKSTGGYIWQYITF